MPWVTTSGGEPWLTFFQMHDVTGDGLADIIRYDAGTDGKAPGGVEVWVNVDGQEFVCPGAGGGNCSIGNVFDTVNAQYVSGGRLTFGDMNADGIDDIVVLAGSGAFRVSFFANSSPTGDARGTRPGQLISINNGRGATTQVQYQSIQDLDVIATAQSKPWSHHSPVVEAVATQVLTQESSVAAGNAALNAPYSFRRKVRYTYRDPAYDGWQRRLVGFRKFASQVGDEAAITETTSWFGPCEDATPPASDVNGADSENSCPHGSDDEFPDRGTFKSWVAKPVRVDRYVPADLGQGVAQQFLWSRYYQYTQPITLFSPSAERHVTFSYASTVETHLYQPELPVSNGANTTPVPGGDAISLPPTQASSKVITTTTLIDVNGSILEQRESGDPSEGDHPVVEQFSDAPAGTYLTCDQTWRCLPTYVTTADDSGGTLIPVRQSRLTYDSSSRDLRKVEGFLSEDHYLSRSHETGGDFSAGPPGQATAGWKTLAEFEYSLLGFVVRAEGPGVSGSTTRSCTIVTPDTAYGQFPQTITQLRDGCDAPAGLETFLAFDRGFERAVTSTAPDLGVRTVIPDAFGRPSSISSPNPDNIALVGLDAQFAYSVSGPVNYVDVTRYTLPGGGGGIRSVQLMNGLGEPVLNFDQGDSGHWIASGWTQRDNSGHAVHAYRTFDNGTTSPTAIAQNASITSPAGGEFYSSLDVFGREVGVTENAVPILQRAYQPLSVVLRDAEQLGAGTHLGAYTKIDRTTRGQARRTTQHTNTDGDITTATTFDAAGDPIAISKVGNTGTYARFIGWDSLGRMTSNLEPNTTNRATVQGWRYSWDDNNRLIGTSDARGCGKDVYYDGLGRIVGEDYSPCRAGQAVYTPPAGGAGFEVVNTYDLYESGQVAPPDGAFTNDPDAAAGRLVSTEDRGAHTRYNYDIRGNVRRTDRQVAKPLSQQTLGASIYAPHFYKTRSDFDFAGRLTWRTGGAEGSFLTSPGNNPAGESYLYSARGLLSQIASDYGTIVDSVSYDPDGQANTLTYGDLAHTKSAFTYDARRRLQEYKTTRVAPSLWSAASGIHYTKPSTAANADWTTQTTLADFTYQLDLVGNPKVIEDAAPATNWRAPQRTRIVGYDDLYRVKNVSYGYTGASPFVSPVKSETDLGDTRPVPPQTQLANRVQHESFSYDSLGNTLSTTDDQNAYYDRSLGTITNGDASGYGPNQLTAATGVHTRYDDAGNLIELKVERPGGTCPSGASGSRCAQWFAYDWDEVGQLARARRWDFATTVPVLGEGVLPSSTPAWDLNYAYSGGERVVKSATDNTGVERHTLDVFSTLRFEQEQFLSDTTGDYEQSAGSTHVYLGGGVADVFYATTLLPVPSPGTAHLHMYLSIGDHLGSSTAVIEARTSEVVERTTYQAFGAVENDFRPDRWSHAREAYKFTGKEEDIEVGATYFGARYYHPHLGRFMSADPLSIHGLGGDLNPYAYVGGRTTSHVDPFGLDGEVSIILPPDAPAPAPAPAPPPVITDEVEVHSPPRSGPDRSYGAVDYAAEQFARIEATRVSVGGGAYVTPGDIHANFGNAVAGIPEGIAGGVLDPTGIARFVAGVLGHPHNPWRPFPVSKDPKNASALPVIVAGAVFAVATGAKGAPEAAVESEAGSGGAAGSSARPTTTVIGRMKDLARFANDPSVDTWAKSGRIPAAGEPPVTWAENVRWLNERVARGDSFGIATDPATLPPAKGGYIAGVPNGYFTARELSFLRGIGIEPLALH